MVALRVMNDNLADIIVALATLVTALGSLIYAIRGDRNSRLNTQKLNEVKTVIEKKSDDKE